MYAENDGTWDDGRAVEVRFPISATELPEGLSQEEQLERMKADRETWPWLGGEIVGQCGPDEWEVAVYDERLAQLEDGSPAPAGTPGEDLRYPTCYRDSSEIREPQPEAGKPFSEMTGDELRAAVGAGVPGAARAYAQTHRVLCAHADQDGRAAHWLEPGEKCPDVVLARLDADLEAGQ